MLLLQPSNFLHVSNILLTGDIAYVSLAYHPTLHIIPILYFWGVKFPIPQKTLEEIEDFLARYWREYQVICPILLTVKDNQYYLETVSDYNHQQWTL